MINIKKKNTWWMLDIGLKYIRVFRIQDDGSNASN